MEKKLNHVIIIAPFLASAPSLKGNRNKLNDIPMLFVSE
jgi:hypothetical protein